jgi:2,3,4,5-tetrahydropyridine-2-carboxylate N-succinyltransferase
MTSAEHPGAHAYGLATVTVDGTVLDVWYPEPQLGATTGTELEPGDLTVLEGEDPVRQVTKVVVHTDIADLGEAPVDAYDVWLRLHLLSHRLVAPHGLNLDGQFGLLANVVWTSIGPCAVADFEVTRARARAAGQHVQVTSVDKFPRMTDYVIPSGVRIGDADRVRLGAYLSEGTTVMHEARSAPRWSRAASPRASRSATAPTSAAAPRSWARSPAAARPSSAWVRTA